MKITPNRLVKNDWDLHPNYEWPDGSISDTLYIKGKYFIELTNGGTIPVFAKFYNQYGGKPNTSIHLRNVNSMRQIKRLYSALQS